MNAHFSYFYILGLFAWSKRTVLSVSAPVWRPEKPQLCLKIETTQKKIQKMLAYSDWAVENLEQL